jgi:general L-amino acid transport system permease protein
MAKNRVRPSRLNFSNFDRRSVLYQAAFLILIMAISGFMLANLTYNRELRGITTGFGFLSREAGFAISETPITYSPNSTYARALLIGLLNTFKVSILAVVLSTLLGLVVGIGKISDNLLVRKVAACFVDVVRNVPLVVQLLLWIGLIRIGAPPPRQAISLADSLFISNRGIQMPSVEVQGTLLWILIPIFAAFIALWSLSVWKERHRKKPSGYRYWQVIIICVSVMIWLGAGSPAVLSYPTLQGFNFKGGWTLSPEFVAILVGLTVYSSAFIAEIVRGGLLSVPLGQTEAARSLGLHDGETLKRIVLPQAVQIMIPPLTSQYLNVFKNSSLAVVIGYPDLVSIGNTTGNQTGQVIEAISIFMAVYLLISLSISLAMNAYNGRLASRER